jgi:hypothetical protein
VELSEAPTMRRQDIALLIQLLIRRPGRRRRSKTQLGREQRREREKVRKRSIKIGRGGETCCGLQHYGLQYGITVTVLRLRYYGLQSSGFQYSTTGRFTDYRTSTPVYSQVLRYYGTTTVPRCHP